MQDTLQYSSTRLTLTHVCVVHISVNLLPDIPCGEHARAKWHKQMMGKECAMQTQVLI